MAVPEEVSIAEAKRDLSEVLEEAQEEPLVVQRRDEPEAVIVPYDDYVRMRRMRAAAGIRRLSEQLRGRGIKLQELMEESRRELEERGER